ncbi:MAG: hypothetical protein RIF33_04560 [Cyclobacteriaceae bacterium]
MPDSITILATTLSISTGILLGAIGNKLVSSKERSGWIFAFYILSLIVLLVPVYLVIVDFSTLKQWPQLLLPFMTFAGGVGIFIFTKRILSVKDIFKPDELTPKINELTEIADKSIIKLFGGDLDFFGSSPKEMDLNSQYSTLKAAGFNKIFIICETPGTNDTTTMVRYGKILTEISGVELKFYNPEQADLRVRGRILKQNGSDRLLMFTKIASKRYKALETDTADSTGALYGNLWDLIWSLANTPKDEKIEEYRSLFSRK